MGWIYLIIAGIGEVWGVMNLKAFSIHKNIKSILLLFLSFGMSFGFLSLAFQSIPMSSGYAVWTGIGTVGSALFGILIYKESANWQRLLFIGLILSGVVGLKLITA